MKKIKQKIIVFSSGIIFIIGALILISAQNKFLAEKPLPENGIVVLELFTSQGCSSCPPADALLAEYAEMHNKHIIPLSFHVDYWNRLGWADPFSKKIYSERQQWYSLHLPKRSVYTPQLIVNGREETVGNNRNAVKKLVQYALTTDVKENILIENISINQGMLRFHYKTQHTNEDEQLAIALVQKQATTHIGAGENEGVIITNHNIVRAFDIQTLNTEGDAAMKLLSPFNKSEYSLVVFVQNKNSLFISTADMKDL